MRSTAASDAGPRLERRTLAGWLRCLDQLDPGRMVLGLDRVAAVFERMGVAAPELTLIVAGTNGKGSCVHLLDALLRERGARVGLYTSPHLHHFRERIRIDGEAIDDEALCTAFERVEAARGEVALSYFEVATLAALASFERAGVDARVLEVGLGGRLDAVNIVAPDAALLTNVGLDHQRWLGPTREAIGHEKAGVFRAGTPAVLGSRDMPASVWAHAQAVGAQVLALGRDFDFERTGSDWRWSRGDRSLPALPLLTGEHQYDNASGCLATLDALGLLPDAPAVRRALQSYRPPGRLEWVDGAPGVLLDVAHNVESITRLADWLQAHPVDGSTSLVFGAMRDKPVDEMIRALAPQVDRWFAVQAPGGRPLPAEAMAERMAAVAGRPAMVAGTPVSGLSAARALTPTDGRIVVAGSFPVVGAARAAL